MMIDMMFLNLVQEIKSKNFKIMKNKINKRMNLNVKTHFLFLIDLLLVNINMKN